MPHLAHQDFCVIDTYGIHSLSVKFCGCNLAQIHQQQFLCVGWFPATVHDPRTICMVNLLHHFHLQTLQSMHLESQTKQFPEYFQLDLVVTAICYLIPKFHLLGHRLTCQSHFSHSVSPEVRRTDKEGVEQDWSWINPAATSTKQMGPGACHDTLDNHWGDMNWHEMPGLHKHCGDN